ncbi:SUMF1/EgtB/PvdO family nonheme iron enzyme [Neolewinella sp.]|uniref:SUMF1/EgtB/PvdO family nonheme iron enzyme n=1 Tax=Neolewinella sp. TaxID=2993543 RepID=UPI003B52CA0E
MNYKPQANTVLRCAYVFLLLPLICSVRANGIAVSNVTLTSQNASAGTTVIQFDLRWENSWRTSVGPANWDAAWIFAKYHVDGSPWRHARLAGRGGAVAGATVEVQEDVGVLIYAAPQDYAGDPVYNNVQLRWDYAVDMVHIDGAIDLRVFAVEMVYIPEGPFYVGDGGRLMGQFREGGTNTEPYYLTGLGPIAVGDGTDQLFYGQVNYGGKTYPSGDQQGPIPAEFPEGFGAFYCMKYELTQEQWVDFFNTLPTSYRDQLDITAVNGKNSDGEISRNGVQYTGGLATTTLPYVAMNFINEDQSLAYLDWAGLRPISELEYEKIGRGPLNPVLDEYAWGSTAHADYFYTLIDTGEADERVANLTKSTGHHNTSLTNPAGTAHYGPWRVGLFAHNAPQQLREETGGSYYGVMELSGNLWERTVTVGSPQGRSYRAVHGDGTLSPDGRADVSGWPLGGDAACGLRGGAFVSGEDFFKLSTRFFAADNRNQSIHDHGGFRGIRSL